ncbi:MULTISPECIES: hypothetical protein [unclassified Paenibacillus]|uniref:hypothetical protein n=1 Tax=unclassified Paenibacillus TaxID=185978 RepID=UPI0007BEDE3D|nr:MULTISPECIES: hypothetical protein [unclassified Paenibacillus]OAX47544.1 hypothetical protein gpAD87_05245 [Paenibacillus sp. AD87]
MLSFNDIETAVAYNAAEIRATLPNGLTFSMKRGVTGWNVPYYDVEKIFKETMNLFRNDPKIMQLWKEGHSAKVNDMLMETIADKIGGIYNVYK